MKSAKQLRKFLETIRTRSDLDVQFYELRETAPQVELGLDAPHAYLYG